MKEHNKKNPIPFTIFELPKSNIVSHWKDAGCPEPQETISVTETKQTL